MNKGTFIGFISSDIKGEDISLKSGETMRKVSFNIACNRKGKNAGADFPRVVAFGKVGEIVEKYFGKGKGVIVEYHVQTSKYNNKDGKTIYQTDLVCDSVEFPPIRKDEENSTPVGNSDNSENVSEDTHPTDIPPSQPAEDFMNIPDNIDSDLPFRK